MFELLNYTFLFLCLVALFSGIFPRKLANFLFVAIFFLLFFISSFREIGFDQDSKMYEDMFRNDGEGTEISFQIITYIIKNVFHGNFFYLLSFYAFISLLLKFYFIKNSTKFIFFSILLYYSYFFVLQDMTQIRVGLASGLLMVMIKFIIDRKIYTAISLFILAILFHTSSVIFFPIFFLSKNSINKKLYFGIIILSYVIYPYINNFTQLLIVYFDYDLVLRKANSYSLENGNRLNVFNAWQLIRLFLSFIFLFYSNLLKIKNGYSIILIKLYIISTCVFVLLSDNPVFSGRISDLYAATDIILIPFLLYLIPNKYNLGIKIIIILIAFSNFYLNLYFNKIFN